MSTGDERRPSAGGLGSWIAARWPIGPVLRWGLDEEIVGGSRFAYALGSLTLFLFLLQLVTGVLELLYYVPTVDHAYASVSYVRLQVQFGWLVHGLHYWGANAFVVVLGLHLARVLVWAAYKKPRELTWIIGVFLLLVAAGLVFTGAVLPWDELGYWAGEVGTSIAGTVPVVGGVVEGLLRGGHGMGQVALSRFFALHVVVLPLLLGVLIIAHLVSFRMHGSVGPWREEKRRFAGRFWPDQVVKDLLLIAGVLVLLIGLSALHRAPFTGPADPLDPTYTPKPEWNFLFLYETLKLLPGRLEWLGAVGVPTVLVGLLLLLPFLDRSRERDPRRRIGVLAMALLLAGGILALTLRGEASGPQVAAAQPATGSGAAAPAQTAAPPALIAAGPPGPAASIIGDPAHGARLFAQYCQGCHGVAGREGLPDPGSATGRVPALQHLPAPVSNADPDSFALNLDRTIQNGIVPADRPAALQMPAFGKSGALTQPEIAHVEAYILKLNGADRTRIARPGIAPRRFTELAAGAFALLLLSWLLRQLLGARPGAGREKVAAGKPEEAEAGESKRAASGN